jgi:hypothetical protein
MFLCSKTKPSGGDWERVPLHGIPGSAKTVDGKSARNARALHILQQTPQLKDLIGRAWKKLHPDAAPATMWDDIATDYIQKWKEEKKQSGSLRELTVMEYYSKAFPKPIPKY